MCASLCSLHNLAISVVQKTGYRIQDTNNELTMTQMRERIEVLKHYTENMTLYELWDSFLRGQYCLGAGNSTILIATFECEHACATRAVRKRSTQERACCCIELAGLEWLLQSLLATTQTVVSHFWKEITESEAIRLSPIMAVSDF